jgi:hypothetical protein
LLLLLCCYCVLSVDWLCSSVQYTHLYCYDQNTEDRNKDKQGQRNTEEDYVALEPFYFEGCTSSTVECFLLLCLFVG